MAKAATTAAGTAAESKGQAPGLRAGVLVGGKYRLETLLGKGAMGEVWRAQHEDLHADVAVKIAHRAADNPAAAERIEERFRFEAQLGAQLSGRTPHIVGVRDVGRHAGMPYLVMEYVRGESLEARLGPGPLDPAAVARVVEHVTLGLCVAHAAEVWHRDIKPANILLAEGEPFVAKISDFGVAKGLGVQLDVDRPQQTSVGSLVGTPAYMSPEQIRGEAPSPRADLWSLAVVAYEALSGRLPFDAENVSDLLLDIRDRPHLPVTLLADVPAGLDGFFERALAKEPEDRFASPRELCDAFRDALAPAPRRRPSWLVAPLAAAALLASAGVWRLSQGPGPGGALAPLPIPTVVVTTAAAMSATASASQPAADTASMAEPPPAPARATAAGAPKSTPTVAGSGPPPSPPPSNSSTTPARPFDKSELQ